MQTFIGNSFNKDAKTAVAEATKGLSNPHMILFFANFNMVEAVAKELKERYPDVPTIGTCAISYYEKDASDNKLIVIGFGSDAKVKVGVLRYLSTTPLYDIMDLKNAVKEVGPGDEDTICMEFCTNDEEILVTTMNVVLGQKKVRLVGGTVFGVPDGKKGCVAVNGEIYEDACCYAVIKNTSGKIRTYSENIYKLKPDAKRHIATKVNLKTKELVQMDYKPASEVYANELGIPKSQIVDNVLENPLGRIIGDEVYICSQYGIGERGSLINYKKFNGNDTVAILHLEDYEAINADTRSKIKAENPKISFVFSVNCIYRHLLFTNKNHLQDFMNDMGSLGKHVGIVGGGEQYKTQHVNQTMVCAVFD